MFQYKYQSLFLIFVVSNFIYIAHCRDWPLRKVGFPSPAESTNPLKVAPIKGLPSQIQPVFEANITTTTEARTAAPFKQSQVSKNATPVSVQSPPGPSNLRTLRNSSIPGPVEKAFDDISQNRQSCSNLRLRKEWRKFSRQEKIDYINAVKCLGGSRSKLLPGQRYRRYDDFEIVHSQMRNKVHWVASFLPWHRHFLFVYEETLQKECGYSGNLPRWDWTLDSVDMSKAPVWSPDPKIGFGGNGRNFSNNPDGLNGGVVVEGAFANWPLYYPDYHLLQRNWELPSEYFQQGRRWGSQFFDPSAIRALQAQPSYRKFSVALEGTDPFSTGPGNPGPHSIFHIIMGGDFSPTAYAANEPLFYLHHANVDYQWVKWQKTFPSSRLNQYGGQVTRGSGTNDAKLTDQLKFLGITADVTVSQTIDTSSFPYCYRYE